MTALKLICDLQRQGFILIPLPEGKLAVKPAEKLTEGLREELKRRKREILNLLNQQQNSPSCKDHYRQAAESVLNDCLTIDPIWLADRQPELWQRMTLIDRQLERLEQRNAEPAKYEAMLEKLVATVRQARALYEHKVCEVEAVQ